MSRVFNSAIVFLIACAVAPSCARSSTVAASPSPRELYLQALNAMSNVREPRYVTFQLVSKSDGLAGELETHCLPCLSPGNNIDRWNMIHRTSDYETEIVDSADDGRYVTDFPIFDPTWFGAYRGLRIGMIYVVGTYKVPPLSATPTPISVAPAATPDSKLRTIAIVATMGPGTYHIEDHGGIPCPNGDSGRSLHLWSRSRNPRHQLSDVIIDLSSMRFCMIRFSLNGPGALGGNATLEEHFGEVGGYWIETNGIVQGTLRIFGISSMHGTWYFRLTHMRFPETIPTDTFNPTLTKE